MTHLKRTLVSFLLINLPGSVVLAQAPEAAPEAAPASAPADPSALLKALPADVTAFVAIPSLRQMDAHVQGVLTQLQLAGMVPGPLDWIRSSAGLGQGLSENGSLAFVILSLKDAKSPEDIGDRLAVFIPTAKPDQLLAGLGAEKEGELNKITLMGQPTVAAAIPGFLVAAEKPETLKAAISPARKGLDAVMSAERARAYAASDLFAWANPNGLSKELRAQLRDAINEMMDKMNPAAGAGSETQPAGAQQIDSILDDVEELTVGVSADNQRGLLVSWFVKPRENSPMAKQAQSLKAVEGSLLAGLPSEPVVAAMGVVCGGADAAKATQAEQMLGQALKVYSSALSSAGVELDEARLMALKEPLVRLFTTMEQFAVSAAGLTEAGEGRLGLTMVGQTADGQAWQASARKLFASLKQLAIDTAKKQGQPDEKINPIADAIQWKEKAEQVEGASVDHLVVDIDKMPKGPNDSPEDLEKIKSFVGKEGLLIRVASMADNHVVVTFGGGQKRFAQILELAKKNDTALAGHPTVKSVASRLPKGPRVLEGYLALDNLLDLVMSTAAQMGSPIPIPLQLRNAAPIAVTVTKVTPVASETQILVPMELMVSVKDLVGPIMMMMGGGMQGQPPPEETTEPAPSGKLN